MNDQLNPNDFKYWAFISYSHADEEWAKWLHKSLETYRVPRKLVGRPATHGKVPKRLFPIFRDRDELPGASDLGGRLKEALTQSRSLIVICSPKSAVSKWVNEEVKTYKTLGLENRVLCLMVDGEPNAPPDSGLLECFPPAVRYQVNAQGEVTNEPAEPIAADARPGKDGKPNALLKLLSGILDVGYNDLKQREKQRQRQRRVRFAALGVAVALLISVAYVAVADAGLNVPGGESIRTRLDRQEASVLRPTRSNAEIRTAAALMRKDLLEALKGGQTAKGGIASNLKVGGTKTFEYWSNGQALTATFVTPELSEADSRQLLKGFDEHFAAGSTIEGADGRKYGWIAHPKELRTQAEPAIWTAAALASALGRPGLLTGEAREHALQRLAYTQEVLKTYRPVENGGWNMFQIRRSRYSIMCTRRRSPCCVARDAQSESPWEGSTERRDQLLRATAQWLADQYDDKASPPGWRAASETGTATIDGLTLQIYGELLRAEAEAGFTLPPRILNQMPDYLAKCAERNFNFPSDSGEFAAFFTDHRGQQYVAREALGFLWYPWAISAAQSWLLRAERVGEPVEQQVRVRRALGHLVNGLGNEAVKKYQSEWTFQAAETLYGLSSIPQNNAEIRP